MSEKITQPNMPASTPTDPPEQAPWPSWVGESGGGIHKGSTPPADRSLIWLDTNE